MRPPRPTPRGAEPPLPPSERALTEIPHDPTAIPAGWEGVMVPGERILWQGHPLRRIDWKRLGPALLAGGALVLAGAVLSDLTGGVLILAGLGLATAALWAERLHRTGTAFTLSTRAAYIARPHPWRGQRVETYPITADMPLRLTGGDKAGGVIFASRTRGTKTQEIGFQGILDAPEVFAILRNAREALR